MQVIFKYIREFYQKEFRWSYYLVICCMIAGIIYLNYWHGLEKNYANRGGWARSFGGYYLMYLLPFASAFFLQYIFLKEKNFLRKPWFWVILLLAPAIFSFRVNFNFHESWLYEKFEFPDLVFYMSSINWVLRVFVAMVPVALIWWIKDRNNQPFYGAARPGNMRPYLIMLAIMVPLLALAATQHDFLAMYPRAQILEGIPTDTTAGKLKYFIYELCYGFDFFSIEFFFRGFLVLSLVKICGKSCIIPAACFYCTIHLGKPMGEAISSFFGGTILGIVSYHTGSIWGGLLVHLGIAWLMEIAGFFGHALQ